MKRNGCLNSRYWQGLLQILRFGIVGVSNNLISLAVYYLVIYFHSELYLLGNALGFLVSTLNAYLWNGKFVFHAKKDKAVGKQRLLKTYCTYILALGVSTSLLYLLVNILQVSPKAAPVCSLMVTVPFTYLMNKLWVYR